MSKRKAHDEFIKELREVNPNIKVLGTYVSSQTRIQVSCNVCGRVWKPTPNSLLQGCGCFACGRKSSALKQRMSDVEFKSRVKEINSNIEVLGTYINRNTPISVFCNICGYTWKPFPSNLLRKEGSTGCPKCAKAGTSFVEQAILLALKKLCSCKVLGRDRKLIGMELDIVVPAMHVAMEYGAWYWHKNRIGRDQEKIRLCRDKGILLIQVFDGYTGGESDTDCVWYYSEDIGQNNSMVRGLIIRICERIGISFTLNDEEFDEILCEAYKNSKTHTTESFNKWLEEMGSKVRILGDYQGGHIKTLAECQECGHYWDIKPSDLVQGKGCPICARKSRGLKRRKSDTEFKVQMKEIHPNIKILGAYVGAKIPISVSCGVCGNIWEPMPTTLLKGCGCPVCGRKSMVLKQRLSDAEFKTRMKRINPNINILGTYINRKTPISVSCNVCGHHWEPSPFNLQMGRGCPECARAVKGAYRIKRVMCVESGIVYDSTRKAKEATNINNSAIVACCRGRRKTAGGYHWKYADEEDSEYEP